MDCTPPTSLVLERNLSGVLHSYKARFPFSVRTWLIIQGQILVYVHSSIAIRYCCLAIEFVFFISFFSHRETWKKFRSFQSKQKGLFFIHNNSNNNKVWERWLVGLFCSWKMDSGSNGEEPTSWEELYNINLIPSELFLKFRKEIEGIRVGVNLEV